MNKDILRMLALIMQKNLIFRDKIQFNEEQNCLEYSAYVIAEFGCFKFQSEVYKLEEGYLKDKNLNYLDTLKYSALMGITKSEQFIEYKK